MANQKKNLAWVRNGQWSVGGRQLTVGNQVWRTQPRITTIVNIKLFLFLLIVILGESLEALDKAEAFMA